MDKTLSDVLEEMKSDYFQNVPEEEVDALFRRFIMSILAR